VVLERSLVSPDTGIPLGIAQGWIFYEDLIGDSQFDIRADIEADMLSIETGIILVCSAYWSVIITTTSIPDQVNRLSGNPDRFKLGQLSLQGNQATTETYFWNYERQSFPQQGCIVSPSTITGYPVSPSDVPAFLEIERLYGAIGLEGNGFSSVYGRSNRDTNYLFGNTGFSIYTEVEDTEYSCTVGYIAAWGNPPSAPGDNVSLLNL